jgi:hypothetical protein
MHRKPHPKPSPVPPKPPVPTIQSQIKDLNLIVIHRTTCSVCQAVLKEMTDQNVIDLVKLVDVDSESWGIYVKNVPNFPFGQSLSLPIIISEKTLKFSMGYFTLSDLVTKLS